MPIAELDEEEEEDLEEEVDDEEEDDEDEDWSDVFVFVLRFVFLAQVDFFMAAFANNCCCSSFNSSTPHNNISFICNKAEIKIAGSLQTSGSGKPNQTLKGYKGINSGKTGAV